MSYTGFTETTPEKLLLDAGAFFKNFEVGTDTFDSAVLGGKLLGATQGGGTFSAIPTIRQIEIDGIKGRAKGMNAIDEWVVTLSANIKEVSEEILVTSLTSGSSATGSTGYKKITGNNYIELTDYINNITWVGKLSGSDTPVIIQVLNALSTGGLTLQTQDKNEAVIALTFTGNYAADDLDTPPFEIHYPTPDVVNGSISGNITDSGGAVSGATVTVIVGSLAISATTDASGDYELNGVLAGTYNVVAVKSTKAGTKLGVVVTAGADTADQDILIA